MSRLHRAPSAEDQAHKRALRATLEEDRALLMTGHPFTAMLAMQLNLIPVADSRLPVAGTDGFNVFFNVHHILRRSAKDRRFILAHEVWHCALGHFRRALGREPARWNHAIDYEVNHLLAEELGYCPPDALYDKRLVGLNAEEVYARLQRRKHTEPLAGQQVLDTHELGTIEQADDANALIDPDYAPHAHRTSTEAQDLQETWRQRLISIAQQRAHLAGNLPGHLGRIIARIREPEVPWQHVLARYVLQCHGGARQWLPPARRYIHSGLYLPSRRGTHLALTLALDNSGSCANVVDDFVAELKGLLSAFDTVELRLLVFDTCIQQARTLTEQSLYELSRFELRGGGGTSFMPVFAQCDETPPNLLVILTDGYGEAPATMPGYPVLWALTDDGACPVPWGNTLTLPGSLLPD